MINFDLKLLASLFAYLVLALLFFSLEKNTTSGSAMGRGTSAALRSLTFPGGIVQVEMH